MANVTVNRSKVDPNWLMLDQIGKGTPKWLKGTGRAIWCTSSRVTRNVHFLTASCKEMVHAGIWLNKTGLISSQDLVHHAPFES